MAILSRVVIALLLSGIALAQKLNGWPSRVFTYPDAIVDGDPTTYSEDPMPGHKFILFNIWENLAGFYIQSSGDFITDYYVSATVDWPLTKLIQVGQVCGAMSNFTLVLFTNEDGGSFVTSDSYFLEVTGSKGNTSILNEIWPIYPGDPIYYPNNTAACPPPTPTATQTPTTSATVI